MRALPIMWKRTRTTEWYRAYIYMGSMRRWHSRQYRETSLKLTEHLFDFTLTADMHAWQRVGERVVEHVTVSMCACAVRRGKRERERERERDTHTQSILPVDPVESKQQKEACAARQGRAIVVILLSIPRGDESYKRLHLPTPYCSFVGSSLALNCASDKYRGFP